MSAGGGVIFCFDEPDLLFVVGELIVEPILADDSILCPSATPDEAFDISDPADEAVPVGVGDEPPPPPTTMFAYYF